KAAAEPKAKHKRLSRRPSEENFGQTRTRTACLPPLYSSAIKTLTSPSRPPLTSRSQRSKSPPRRRTARSTRREDSRDRSRSSEASQPSLQSQYHSGISASDCSEPGAGQ